MSYMTDILNSMSMKVSSGYEILSFRMHWKGDKEIIFSHFYHSGPCAFAEARVRAGALFKTASAYQRHCCVIAASGERKGGHKALT